MFYTKKKTKQINKTVTGSTISFTNGSLVVFDDAGININKECSHTHTGSLIINPKNDPSVRL